MYVSIQYTSIECGPESELQFRCWRCNGEHRDKTFACIDMNNITDSTNDFPKTTSIVTIMRNLLAF